MLENVRKQMSPAEANKIGVGFGDWAGCLREDGRLLTHMARG